SEFSHHLLPAVSASRQSFRRFETKGKCHGESSRIANTVNAINIGTRGGQTGDRSVVRLEYARGSVHPNATMCVSDCRANHQRIERRLVQCAEALTPDRCRAFPTLTAALVVLQDRATDLLTIETLPGGKPPNFIQRRRNDAMPAALQGDLHLVQDFG